MKRVSLLVALAALAAGGAGPVFSQPRQAPVRIAAFMPRTVGPWVSGLDRVYDSQTIFQYLDGAGEVYRSYHMRLLVSRQFHKEGHPEIVADLFDMGSSEDAFGIFTDDVDGEDAGIGQGSSYQAGLLTFWKDRYFGSVSAERETPESKDAVLELGRRIAAAIPKNGPTPRLLAALPPEGLDARHVRYLHDSSTLNDHFFVADKDILELDQTASAVLAPYVTAGGKSFLLVVSYPDEDRAGRAFESFSKSYMPGAKRPGIFRTVDRKWTASARAGDIVIVVFNADSDQFAMNQLAAVQELIETGNIK
jgi:hypothetical protein